MNTRSCTNCEHFYLDVMRTNHRGFCRQGIPSEDQEAVTHGYHRVLLDDLRGQWNGNGTCAASLIRVGSYVTLKDKLTDATGNEIISQGSETPLRVVAINSDGGYHIRINADTARETNGRYKNATEAHSTVFDLWWTTSACGKPHHNSRKVALLIFVSQSTKGSQRAE